MKHAAKSRKSSRSSSNRLRAKGNSEEKSIEMPSEWSKKTKKNGGDSW